MEGVAVLLMILLCLLLVPALTIWNIAAFVRYLTGWRQWWWDRSVELVALVLGYGYMCFYWQLGDVRWVDWSEQLYNWQRHGILALDTLPSVAAVVVLALAGFLVLRFVPASRQPPVVCVLALAGVYCGIGLCMVWCIQTAGDLFLMLYPANCVLLFLKVVCMAVHEKNELWRSGEQSVKYERLAGVSLWLERHLPWAALAAVVPLLGVLVAALTLLGQTPDSLLRAWTETADWTFSRMTGPPNIMYDEHYLCTVAAGGHPRLVRPLRPGMRRGHAVVVNRQLCIANAFEQLLEERTPRLHRAVRGVYDRTGYPIARHIRSPWAADVVYLLMKPLEWLFLLVLYTADARPEDRIAVQYPHAPLPKTEGRAAPCGKK